MRQHKNLITRTCPQSGGDFFRTPRALTEELLRHAKFEGVIWEPACGDGAISEVLKEKGYSVISSDLYDRGYGEQKDFLKESPEGIDNIITNPPFNIADKFLEHALNVANKKVAMLFPIRYLSGKSRKKIFDSWPISKLIVIPYKVDFTGGNNPMFEVAWFVWNADAMEQRIIIGGWK